MAPSAQGPQRARPLPEPLRLFGALLLFAAITCRLVALPPVLAADVLAGSRPLSSPEPFSPSAGSQDAACPLALSSRPAGSPALIRPAVPPEGLPGYAAALASTASGWPRLDRWCVWIEPVAAADGPEARRWQAAVGAALAAWGRLLPVRIVEEPAAAQVRLLRRRPPLCSDSQGRPRASRGRALLSLAAVQRQAGVWRLEPSVLVLIDPGQRAMALQATALHELGHAFGLWGHSDDPADAMAEAATAEPVLEPSGRDRQTLRWLQQQPSRFGQPLPAGALPPPGLDR